MCPETTVHTENRRRHQDGDVLDPKYNPGGIVARRHLAFLLFALLLLPSTHCPSSLAQTLTCRAHPTHRDTILHPSEEYLAYARLTLSNYTPNISLLTVKLQRAQRNPKVSYTSYIAYKISTVLGEYINLICQYILYFQEALQFVSSLRREKYT